jgi:hypothetical protein
MRLRAAAATCSARRARHGQGGQSPAAIGHLPSPDITNRGTGAAAAEAKKAAITGVIIRGGREHRPLSRIRTGGRARFGSGVPVTNR